MNIKEIIKELCENFNIPPIDIDEHSNYILTINGKNIHIEKSLNHESVYIYSYIFPALNKHDDELAKKLMEINAYGKVTGTAQISFSPEKSQFVLSETFILNSIENETISNRLKEWEELLDYFEEQWPKWQLEFLASSSLSKKESIEQSEKLLFKL